MSRDKSILLFGLVTYGIGQSLLYVIFGPLARDLGLTELQFGVLISASNVALVIFSPMWGRVSQTIGRKKVFIIGGIVAVLVIAAFLLVGLLGMVPADIKGTWYEINGYDYEYEFLTFGKIEYVGHGETLTGTYVYDEETKIGTISSDEQDVADREFTFDNATITMGPSIFTRQYVEQFTSESFLESIVDEIDALEE